MKKIVKLFVFGMSLFLAACNGDETKSTAASDSTAIAPAATDTASKAQAMDAATVAPNLYKVLKDSMGIRILQVTYKPGDSSAMHSHPDNVLYVVESGRTQFTMQDGSKQTHDLKAGTTMILPGGLHSVKNVGTTTTNAILFEINRANKPGPAMDVAMDAVKVAPDQHKLVKDTMNIRAIIFTSKPGSVTQKHSHPDDAVYVIEGGKAEFTLQDGTKQVKDLQKGMVTINPAATHSFKNIGSTEIKTIVVEVNRPQ